MIDRIIIVNKRKRNSNKKITIAVKANPMVQLTNNTKIDFDKLISQYEMKRKKNRFT